MKKKILLVSIITIVLCISVIAGSTFALFTTKTEVNIAVQAGELGVTAVVQDETVMVKSLGTDYSKTYQNQLPNGGSVKYESGKLTINQMTPGDGITFQIKVKNEGDVAVAYAVDWATAYNTTDNKLPDGKKDIFSALKITVTVDKGEATEKSFDAASASKDVYHALGAPSVETTFDVTVEFVNGNGNDDYQGALGDIMFTVKTVQANAIDSNGKIIY